MFDPSATPRVFAVPPGADFPQALVRGLRARCDGHPPEALARVQLVLNTRRMARRVRDLFDQGPPCLLPRISLVTDLGESALRVTTGQGEVLQHQGGVWEELQHAVADGGAIDDGGACALTDDGQSSLPVKDVEIASLVVTAGVVCCA